MVELRKELTLGKKVFDVSNISAKRKRIAKDEWNRIHGFILDGQGEVKRDGAGQPLVKPRNVKPDVVRKEIQKLARYLIRQDFKILLRRFNFLNAVKEFLRRLFLTISYIDSLTEKESDELVYWLYEVLLGYKKKELNAMEMLSPLLTEIAQIMEPLNEKEQQDLLKFYMESFLEQVGQWKKSKATQKVS